MKTVINKHYCILAVNTLPGAVLSAKPATQKGAVLVLALVMLTVLTLIGVSSMSRSSLELKIASNAQQHHIAFQAAQSRLAFVGMTNDPANPIDFLIPVDFDDPSSWTTQTCNLANGCPGGANWAATATMVPLDCNEQAVGYSWEKGKSLVQRYFAITAVGMTAPGGIVPTSPARSTQVSAVRFFARNC